MGITGKFEISAKIQIVQKHSEEISQSKVTACNMIMHIYAQNNTSNLKTIRLYISICMYA